jgi:hypothetical protein
MKPATHIYVGVRKIDGSIRAACCDDAGEEKETAKLVADWIKRGLSVERLTEDEYQARYKPESGS